MTTSHSIIQQILKVIIFGTFLFGCAKPSATPSPDEIDLSPFTGIPCAAPCWQGLMIGKSSESDVMSKLSTLTFIDQSSIYVHKLYLPSLDPRVYAQGTEITANCIYSVNQCIRLRIADNVLSEIVITLDYEVTLNEAVESLGEPHYVGYQDLGAEVVICEIDLLWTDRQLILASESFHGSDALNNCKMVRDTHKTISNLRIVEARYVSNLAMDFMLTNPVGQFFEFTGTLPEQ